MPSVRAHHPQVAIIQIRPAAPRFLIGVVSVFGVWGGMLAEVVAKKAAPLHKAKQRKTIAIFTLTCIA
jgi:hypothetical protein